MFLVGTRHCCCSSLPCTHLPFLEWSRRTLSYPGGPTRLTSLDNTIVHSSGTLSSSVTHPLIQARAAAAPCGLPLPKCFSHPLLFPERPLPSSSFHSRALLFSFTLFLVCSYLNYCHFVLSPSPAPGRPMIPPPSLSLCFPSAYPLPGQSLPS